MVGDIDGHISQAKEVLKELDDKEDGAGLNADEVKQRKDAMFSLCKYERMKEQLRCQQSRIRWLKEGDNNSRFFHRCLSRRKRSNFIQGILVGEELVCDVPGIRETVKEHFVNLFDKKPTVRLGLESIAFNRIGDDLNSKLIAPFTMEEIKKTVWDCDNDKSPGPDGVNFGFLKQFWESMRVDLLNCFSHFHRTGRLVKGGNASFIVFVLKKDNPQRVDKYRPICLIGCVYKGVM